MKSFLASLAIGITGTLLSASHLVAGEVRYVDLRAGGAADGSSWYDAFPALGLALAVAEPGDQVWVADGTYTPDPGGLDRSLSFDLVDGVELYGGFAGTESCLSERDPAAHATILSGDLAGNDPPLGGCEPAPNFAGAGENSWHVVRGVGVGSGTVLDGFTITGGNADGPGIDRFGGGILLLSSSPQIRRCTVIRNSTGDGGAVPYGDGDGGDGGGIHGKGASPTIRDSVICSNRAGSGLGTAADPGHGGRGGGISLSDCADALITGCTVRDNAAGDGADTSDPAGPIDHFGGDGGGIFINSSAPVRIERSAIEDNRAGRGGFHLLFGEGGRGGSGGGLAATASDVLLIDSRLEGNESGGSPGATAALPSGAGGGASFTASGVRVERTVFIGNRTADGCAGCGVGGGSGSGGAIDFAVGTGSIVTECRFIGNETGANQREFVGDTSGAGGAIASSGGPLVVAGSVFHSNRTGFGGVGEDGRNSGPGGALWLEGDSDFAVSNCELAGNATGSSGPPALPIGAGTVGSGGAIACALSPSSRLTIANCTVIGNRTGTLSGPGVSGESGGIFVTGGSSCVLNSILYGNADSTGTTSSAQVAGACVEFSCVEGWTSGGPGNFSGDPLLRDAAGPEFDLRVEAASPCIDAADPSRVPPDRTDVDGDGDPFEPIPFDIARAPRHLGSYPDVGAHEFQGASFVIRSAAARAPAGDVAGFDPATGEGELALAIEAVEDPTNAGFPRPIEGISICGQFDPERLAVVSVEPGADLLALGAEFDPAAFEVELCDDGFSAEFALGIAGSALVADEPREVLVVRFSVIAGAAAGLSSPGLSTEVWLRPVGVCPPTTAVPLGTLAAGGADIAPYLEAIGVRLEPLARAFPFIRGDCNSDGDLDIADAVALLDHILGEPALPGRASLECPAACDGDDDGDLDLADAILSIQRIVFGGAFPAPWPFCGTDPTAGGTTCCRSSGPCS